jgi:hypothetical protein
MTRVVWLCSALRFGPLKMVLEACRFRRGSFDVLMRESECASRQELRS